MINILQTADAAGRWLTLDEADTIRRDNYIKHTAVYHQLITGHGEGSDAGCTCI